MTPWLTIIGVGADGRMAPEAEAALAAAEVVLGPERLLAAPLPSPLAGEEPAPDPIRGGASVPDEGWAVRATPPLPSSPARGEVKQWRGPATNTTGTLPLVGRAGEGVVAVTALEVEPWSAGRPAMLAQVEARRGRPTAILATGDPMWFGIGATLAKHFDPGEFVVHPAPSAFQLAAARLRWPLQHVATISLHGRAIATLHPHLLPGNRILALTSDRATITAVSALLVARGYGDSLLAILENLGAPDERITTTTADTFDAKSVRDFHVLAIDCAAAAGAPLLTPVPGLPDDVFRSDGQLTKREVRAATLARLAPYPGALLWDVGAGCGSVGIEWLRAARDARAVAFERDAARCALIAENAAALGVPGLLVVPGEAPATLAGQPPPDAIFLGGDVANVPLFEACWSALKPGGRLVANAVTLDGEAALFARQAQLGGELVRIEVSALDRIGAERVFRPRLAVTQWATQKP